MINVSNEFRILMNQRTDFKQNAEITLADGTLLTLSEKDFTIANNSVVDGAGSNGIPLGVAICRNIQIELMNDDERFSDYDFFGAVIRLYLTFQLSETVERIEYGTLTVLAPSTAGTTVIITALDDMYKADKEYSTGLTFPATVKSMWVDACNTIGIVPGTTSFNNDDFIVSAKPEGVTFRQVLGYIAMIAGGNARIDLTGRMQIVSYDFSSITDAMNMISGGNFKKWDNEETVDGGDFTFSEAEEVIDGGNFTDKLPYHILGNWKDLTVDTDDITITGVSATVENEDGEEEVLIYGSEGYMLSIENPLIIGNERLAVQLIGEIMVGGTFRQFSGDITANPLIEFMDTVLVIDRKMNLYPSFVTDINFQFFGFTSVKNSATPALTNGNSYPTDATKTLVKVRELINKERTAREAAIEQLAKNLANSSGLFMTQEVQEDESVIYYMHDKPKLAESMIIWKLTALAFGISTDGGKTYPYGFTVDGTTITRLLYAEGIDADYINTGAIRIADTSENELFYADYDTKEVRINADKVLIGSSTVKEYVDSSQKSAIKSANNNTSEQLKSYSTTVAMNSAISTKADEILLSASKTYETITESDKKYENLSGKITVNADAITAEVSRATNAENSLSSKISVNTDSITAEVQRAQGQEVELAAAISLTVDQISLKVSKGDVSSQLSVESGAVTIKSNRFSWESTYSSLTTDGKLTATDVKLTGEITADSGKIGGFTIGTSALYNTKSSMYSNTSGVYIGTDGIAVGSGSGTGSAKFAVTKDGAMYLGYNSEIHMNGALNFENSLYAYMAYNGSKKMNFESNGINFYDDIFIPNTGTCIKSASNASNFHIKFETSKVTIGNIYSVIGKNGGYVGFFGSDGAVKKSVSTIVSTTSATALAVASKVNELINALKAYNLIG